jgi:superfamily II DNA/RNA helicase
MNTYKGDRGWISKGTRNEDELQARLASCYLRRTEADVGAQVPALTRVLHRVDGSDVAIDPTLRKFIGKSRVHALDILREHFQRSSYGRDTLEMLMAWRKWTSRAKLPHTADYVASLFLEGEHVVVFAWERYTVERLAELIPKACKAVEAGVDCWTMVVHGGLEQERRDELIAQFQASNVPIVLIATIDSLKEGVTLHRARHTVQHDLHYIPAVMFQADKRTNRIGQTRPCTSAWMMVEDSADEIIAEHLLRKADDVADALGDVAMQESLDELALNVRDRGSEDAQQLLQSLLTS